MPNKDAKPRCGSRVRSGGRSGHGRKFSSLRKGEDHKEKRKLDGLAPVSTLLRTP